MRDIKIGTTNRGFAIITFKDRYGEPCSVQKSSLATEDAIWLGADKVQRMHLSREDACRLISILEAFVEFGELPDTIAECQQTSTA